MSKNEKDYFMINYIFSHRMMNAHIFAKSVFLSISVIGARIFIWVLCVFRLISFMWPLWTTTMPNSIRRIKFDAYLQQRCVSCGLSATGLACNPNLNVNQTLKRRISPSCRHSSHSRSRSCPFRIYSIDVFDFYISQSIDYNIFASRMWI